VITGDTSLIYFVLKCWFIFYFDIQVTAWQDSFIPYSIVIFLSAVTFRQQKHNLQALNYFCHFRDRLAIRSAYITEMFLRLIRICKVRLENYIIWVKPSCSRPVRSQLHLANDYTPKGAEKLLSCKNKQFWLYTLCYAERTGIFTLIRLESSIHR